MNCHVRPPALSSGHTGSAHGLYEAVLFHYCKLELIVAALWAVEHLLKSAGMVPAEDHPVFARLLNAQGIHDKESLLKSLTENPRLLSTIGMSFDQQSCLMRYLGCGSVRVKPAAENASSAITSAE